MQIVIFISTVLILTFMGYYMGRSRSILVVEGDIKQLHSLPRHYGYYVAIWCGIPSFLLCLLWAWFEPLIIHSMVLSELSIGVAGLSSVAQAKILNDIQIMAAGVVSDLNLNSEINFAAQRYNDLQQIGTAAFFMSILLVLILALLVTRKTISSHFKAREVVETTIKYVLLSSSIIAVLTTVGIVASLLFEAIRFFGMVSFSDFLFGLEWSPQVALRKDQVASQGSFGAVPIFAGTLLISFIAMCIAVPIGLMSAIYMSEYATPKLRAIGKPILEILAGVPTVVYGFFAALVVAPTLRTMGESAGVSVSSESALAAGLVMGVMIIPFVSSLSDDVIRAVPQSLRDGSYALGATQSETIKRVVFPAALPGIMGAVMLAISRAIGETMIVVMAAGLSANLTANPLHALTTATVQMVTLLVGDQEFDSPKTLAAFALGLVLFCLTLCLNVIALRVVAKYREKYD